MNRMVRSRLGAFGVVLLLTIALGGCCQMECLDYLWAPPLFADCLARCEGAFPSSSTGFMQSCSETPEGCCAMFEYYQDKAIEVCGAHPEECQQYFVAWVESLDKEKLE